MIDLRGFARKTGGAQLAQGGSVFTDANRALGDGQEPIQSPHPLAGLADLLKNAANPDQGSAAEKFAPMPAQSIESLNHRGALPQLINAPTGGTTLPQPNNAPSGGTPLDLSGLAQGQGPQGGGAR